ncbi:MAG: RtcB family protein [Peptococcaceae bacterium]|nr:RtcB family protein [Peptococcaceae bacterium]
MFVIYNKKNQRVPIKVWLEDINQLEEGCLKQAINLSNLPFVYKWVALMPDTHQGYGMPIGGVIATEGVIIPNAVGVDIGCGIAFVETSIHK